MNPQEPSARRLVKSISLLPPRERGNVSSRTQNSHTCSNPLHPPHRPKERGNESPRAQRSSNFRFRYTIPP